MLSKQNRLRKKSDFDNVFKRGKPFKSGSLLVKIIKNNLEISRFGFIVSKKVSKKAVERNKIKRWLSGVTMGVQKDIKQGFDIVFFVLPEAKDKNYLEIKNSVIDIFKKTKLCSNP